MVDFYVPSSLKCGAHLSCSDLSRKSMGKEKVTLNNTTPIKRENVDSSVIRWMHYFFNLAILNNYLKFAFCNKM